MKIKYKVSLSESLSLSDSGILQRSMRKSPRTWLAAMMLVLFALTLLLYLIMSSMFSDDRGRASWLAQYYSRTYGRAAPSDKDFTFTSPVKAVILVLCRNSDLTDMEGTVINFEKRFNNKYRYPYVFLNDEEFSKEFKRRISAVTSGVVHFGLVPKEHWSYPSWIDQEKAKKARDKMAAKGVIYGGSESYRFMCRYYSGFFYQHPLLSHFEYYWRLEPGVSFTCDINYDVFKMMKARGKKYGFVITMQEIYETIPTLWRTVLEEYLPRHPRLVEDRNDNNNIRYFGPPSPHGYNGCHFWSNFEIGSFDLFRSSEYKRFFEVLDRAGGFFYERWGDAPVHSIAVGLFLSKDQVHYFEDIGYRHAPFSHCPADFVLRKDNNCDCDPFDPNETAHGRCQNLWDIHNNVLD